MEKHVISLSKQSRIENDKFHLGLNLLGALPKNTDCCSHHPQAIELKIQGTRPIILPY